MKPKVYVETSVISYLASRPSRDVVIAGRQAVTQEWWDLHRKCFDVYISELVELEMAALRHFEWVDSKYRGSF